MRNYGTLNFLLIYFFPSIACSQNMEQQASYYSSRMRNPVKIEVTNSGKEITFIAENTSYYPYELEIEFTRFINLSPMMSNYKNVIRHGSNFLFKLTIIDNTSNHDYTYNLRYRIGYTNKIALINYPYPIPLTEGKEIKLFPFISNNDTVFYKNTFVMNSGDTIVCMRKGIVTNILSSDENQDRILKTSSIEVLHEDGTALSYSISDPGNCLVKPGQNVYPLQPLLVLKKPGTLAIQMFDINNMSVKPIDFILEPGEAKEGNPKIKFVAHSSADIERELTGKEMKKLAKGNLY